MLADHDYSLGVSSGLEPDLVCYSVALGACADVGRWDLAQTLLGDMKSHNLAPTVGHYNAALRACAHQGQWNVALTLMYQVRHHLVVNTKSMF